MIFTVSVFLHANGGPIGAKATVSNKHIVVGDIVELKIRGRGNRVTFPTIRSIDGIKVLSREERVTNVHTYVRGEFQRERTTLILTFAPQKEMTIPSYEVEIDGKHYKTDPIRLKVKDAGKSRFSLKLSSSKRSVIVGEAFLVTVYFSLEHGAIVSDKPDYRRPKFNGFFVEEADKGKSYDEGDNQVTALTYILTPHTEGNFTLGPAHAKIGLLKNREKENSKIGLSKKWLNRASNTLEIEVLPKMKESDLVGNFSLEAKIDRQVVEVNKPVELTVKIEGEGNLVNFDLPDYELDDVTIYHNDAKVEIKEVDGRIFSSYSKKFVFISDENFTIPERIVRSYDPQKKKLKVLKMDAIKVTIKKSDLLSRSENSMKNTRDQVSTGSNWKEIVFTLLENRWILLLLVLLPAALFLLWRFKNKGKERSYDEKEALSILYGHISKDPEVEEMVRRLYARKNGDSSVVIDEKRLRELIKRYS